MFCFQNLSAGILTRGIDSELIYAQVTMGHHRSISNQLHEYMDRYVNFRFFYCLHFMMSILDDESDSGNRC